MSASRVNHSLVLLFTLVVVLVFASPALAFGAGNIASVAKIEGKNFRHGDIEVSLVSVSPATSQHGNSL